MAVVPQEENGGLLRYRVTRLEEAVKDLSKKVDSMQTRQTSLLITIAASAIVFALTVLTGTGRL
jgi:hypothetical protein